MSRPTKSMGPRPSASVTGLFGKMIAAQGRGDYIRAGEAQQALEGLGWSIRRKRARGRKAGAAAVLVATQAASDGDAGASDVDRDQLLAGGVLGLVDVAWLVGASVEEVEQGLAAARFPHPDGYVSGKPYWETATLDRWANRGGRL